MKFPKGYEHLGKIGKLPRMVEEALKLVGTVETAGAKDNPVIMGWAKETGNDKGGYSADSVPWCGLFIDYVAMKAGKARPKHPLWALNWKGFGIPKNQPCLGDVLTFKRNGGGHVGIYIGEDQTAYHVLGGNQSDAVNITRIAKTRMHSVSRPEMKVKPDSVKPYILKGDGQLSTNEQ